MRILIAGACALLLLALMPAFALLRYEHATGGTARRTAPPDPAAVHATDLRRERPIPIGPSIMTRFGSNANAASPTAILERRLARVALAGIQDSIPRPAGAPLERFAAGVELAAFFPPAQPNDDGFDPF